MMLLERLNSGEILVRWCNGFVTEDGFRYGWLLWLIKARYIDPNFTSVIFQKRVQILQPTFGDACA